MIEAYFAQLARQVEREDEGTAYVTGAAGAASTTSAPARVVTGTYFTLDQIAAASEAWVFYDYEKADGAGVWVRSLTGSFDGIDFEPCQQIKLDPPKDRSHIKPAIAGLMVEQSGRYMGLGWVD